MNAKERVLAALAHQPTDTIPFSLGFGINPPARETMAPLLHMESGKQVNEYLQTKSDLAWVTPQYIGPKDRNVRMEDGRQIDIWGVERKPVSYGSGSYDEITAYPLSEVEEISELENYRFPDPDWFDYSVLPQKIQDAQKDGPKAIVLGTVNPFESSWYLRGLENLMADLILEPELANEILRRVTDFFYEYLNRALKAAGGGIDIVFTADDIGQQQGLMMSLDCWRENLKPYHQKLNALIHSYGAKVMYHSDGAVMEAVEELIDMGIDVLEALQFDAVGMDPVVLKEKYGDRLCFHGGVSVQSTLPFGTEAQVTREVEERIAILGKNGGYILAPSHAVQANTPPENILAFFKAAGRPL